MFRAVLSSSLDGVRGRITLLTCACLVMTVAAVWGAAPSEGIGGLALVQPSDPYVGVRTPSANADTAGMFSPVMSWPLVAIHATVARSGEIVTYGSPLGKLQQGALQFDNWNPSTNEHVQSPLLPVDSFCNLNLATTDGRLMMAGGNSQMTSGLYDPASRSYASLPGFAYPRWYASMVRLPDNRFVVVGGAEPKAKEGELESRFASTPEILSPGAGSWVPLPDAKSVPLFGSTDYAWWYPKAYLAPSGNVFGISQNRMWVLDPDGRGSVTEVGTVPGTGYGSSASSVMYEPGKILLAGGGQRTNEDVRAASKQAAIIDISTDAPTAVSTNPMSRPRNWVNLTVLPNGEVLANGGTEFSIDGTQVYSTEIWNPTTKAWRTGASAQKIRTYHSTALLMPSGAVFTSGGGAPGPVTNLNTELYYPPQLFARDGSGKVVWADRPEFRSVFGTLARGGSATFEMKDGRTIQSVSLTSAGSVTHSYNSDQRRIPLSFVQSGSDVTVQFPTSATKLPPGVYLLNAVDSAGVPAPSQIIEIMADNTPGPITLYGSGTQIPPTTAATTTTTSTTTTSTTSTTTTSSVPASTTTTSTTSTTTTSSVPASSTTSTTLAPTTTTSTSPPQVPTSPPLQSRFVPIDATRVMDTRDGTGVPAGLRPRGSSTVLTVTGGRVPTNATAVVLNATIDQSVGAGYVQVYPTGRATEGSSSNLNVPGPGSTMANLVIVPVGSNGRVTFFNHAGGHLIADLVGYFTKSADATSDGRFVGLPAPSRVLDTRSPYKVPVQNPGDVRNCSSFSTWDQANRWMWTYIRHGDVAKLDADGNKIPCESLPGNPGRVVIPPDLFKLGSGATYRLPIRSTATPAGGVLPAGAAAVVMNVTVDRSAGPGYLQVFDDPADKTKASNLNYRAGDTAANLVIAPIGDDGSVKLFAKTGTHVIVDVVGYFTDSTAAPSTAGLFVPFAPDRLVNTRNEGGVRPTRHLRNENVAALAGLKADDVGAMFMNATLTDSLSAGFLQVYPTGQSTPGASSTINVTGPGQTRPNAVITGVASGSATVYLHAGGNFILDAAGYFVADAA